MKSLSLCVCCHRHVNRAESLSRAPRSARTQCVMDANGTEVGGQGKTLRCSGVGWPSGMETLAILATSSTGTRLTERALCALRQIVMLVGTVRSPSQFWPHARPANRLFARCSAATPISLLEACIASNRRVCATFRASEMRAHSTLHSCTSERAVCSINGVRRFCADRDRHNMLLISGSWIGVTVNCLRWAWP